MVLISFSEPSHVPLLFDGRKQQTTRLPRKRPIKVGDILHCYYKPRMKKSCENCLLSGNLGGNCLLTEDIACSDHNNFFGTAVVKEMIRTRFVDMSPEMKANWATVDGFKNFAEADAWFTRTHGDEWSWKEFDVIFFEPHWLQEGDSE